MNLTAKQLKAIRELETWGEDERAGTPVPLSEGFKHRMSDLQFEEVPLSDLMTPESTEADFVVGPLLDEETAKLCNRRKIPYMPGCGTLTEIHKAHTLGVEICKVFPGKEVGGPGFVKNVKGPCPWTEIMPTGGVEPTEESLSSWFKAGIACAGIGSNLITKEIVAAGDFAALTKKVQETLALIRKVRPAK